MSITYVPAKKAITRTTIEVIRQPETEKYVLELTREQFLFVVMCAGQLCASNKKADPIGYNDYSKYKKLIGFESSNVNENEFQKLAKHAEEFFANKP